MTRLIAWATLTITLVTGAVVAGDAREVVKIRLRGHFFSEPATVQITIAVEPDANNRRLRIAADAETYYRESEVTLEGERDKRLHTIQFRSLPAGTYRLTAEVLSSEAVLGKATLELVVTSSSGR